MENVKILTQELWDLIIRDDDGKKAAIRAVCIEGVTDNADDRNGEEVRFACRTIWYSGRSINVLDSYEDIMEKIYNAEL